MLAPLLSVGDMPPAVCWRVGLKFACTSGKYLPC